MLLSSSGAILRIVLAKMIVDVKTNDSLAGLRRHPSEHEKEHDDEKQEDIEPGNPGETSDSKL
jgi:hypothetical protein